MRQALLLFALAIAPLAIADDELGWSDTAEFSLVATAGNSDSQTFGFKNTLLKRTENSLFTFRAGGVRAEAASAPFFVWDGTDFLLVEPDREKTAENYVADLRYDRDITERFFWYAGLGWLRNRFSGIENRYVATGGVGNIWLDEEGHKFRTTYGVTFTDEEQTDGTEDDFGGARVGWNYLNQLTETTVFTNDLILDVNLDETDDIRADMVSAVQVAISDNMALKASLQWLYDNMPAVIGDTLVVDSSGGVPIPVTPARELDELDSIFSVSLVVDF